MMEALLPFIERFGLPTALVILFVYLDLRRRKLDDKDKEMTIQRLAKLEDYQRDKMEGIVVENTTALQNNAEATKEMSRASKESIATQKQLILMMRTRKCLADAVDQIDRDVGGGGC
jgi:hypothetical protein